MQRDWEEHESFIIKTLVNSNALTRQIMTHQHSSSCWCFWYWCQGVSGEHCWNNVLGRSL